MGCVASQEDKLNKKIDNEQKAAENNKHATISLLLMGSGESGKSTIRHQLSRLHTDAFTKPEERSKFLTTILSNVNDGMVDLLQYRQEFLGEAQEEEAIKMLEDYRRASLQSQVSFVKECVDIIRRVFKDEAEQTKEVMNKNYRDLQLPDSFQYYVDQLVASYPTWGGEGWVPSADDCLRARQRTSGVVRDTFQHKGVEFELYDVGGQRSERRKWMHCFQEVTAALFVASLGDYDQVLFEDRDRNRLIESLELFQESVNSRWLSATPVMLFLNKKDIFDRKYTEEKIPLNVSGNFPNAPESNDDPKAAIKWISEEFKARKMDMNKHKQANARAQTNALVGKWFVHVCTATDKNTVEKVFKDITAVILTRNLDSVFGSSDF